MFEPLLNYIPKVARKFHVAPQVRAAVVCNAARKVLSDEFPALAPLWVVKKFQNKTLTIQARDHSSASELRMRTQYLLEIFAQNQDLKYIVKIKINVI